MPQIRTGGSDVIDPFKDAKHHNACSFQPHYTTCLRQHVCVYPKHRGKPFSGLHDISPIPKAVWKERGGCGAVLLHIGKRDGPFKACVISAQLTHIFPKRFKYRFI